MQGSRVTFVVGLAMVGCATAGDAPRAAGTRPSPASPGTPSTDAAPTLSIELYENGVGVIYRYDALLERLRQGGAGAVAEQLHENDVRRYVVGPAPSTLVAMQLTPEASARWRRAVPPLAETRPFVVSLGGKQLFSGVLYPVIGAAAIDTPVVHVTERDGAIILTFAAFQGAAYMRVAPAGVQRIDLPELRELFLRRGALEEEPKAPSPLGSER